MATVEQVVNQENSRKLFPEATLESSICSCKGKDLAGVFIIRVKLEEFNKLRHDHGWKQPL